MPILKSSIKRVTQNAKRREINSPFRSKLKSVVITAMKLISDGKFDEAVKYIPRAYSVIDTAEKKNIIKKNTASRKKSSIAKALNELQAKLSKTEEVKSGK